MALWQVDKVHGRRLSPISNSRDNIGADRRMADNAKATITNKMEEDTSTRKVTMQDGKIEVTDASGNTHTRIGFDSTDGDSKTKVAKPGNTL